MSFGINDEVVNQPRSFGQGDEVISPVSSFGANDEIIKPADSGRVLNQNTTGFPLQPDFRPNPATYGDAMAMMRPQDVQEPGLRSSEKELFNAPLTALGQVTAGIGNILAEKELPDERNQYDAYELAHGHPARRLRNFLEKGLFGPSNLSVLGKDPKQEMFHQGQSLLPPEQKVIGSDSDLRKMAEGLITPEGVASVPLMFTRAAPLLNAAYAASTAVNAPDMTRGDLMANAVMMGAPLAFHKMGQGAVREPSVPNMEHMNGPRPLDVSSLQDTLTQNQISRSVPLVKETNPPNELVPSIGKQPTDTTVQAMPVGGDNEIVAGENATTMSRGTLSPADLGKQLGYKVQQWDPSIPVLGGSFSLTDLKTGMTVENLRPGVSLEEVQRRMAEKNVSPSIDTPATVKVKQPDWTTVHNEDNSLFIENVRKPLDQAIPEFETYAKENNLSKIKGNVQGEARQRLFSRYGFKTVKQVGNQFVMEKTVTKEPVGNQRMNPESGSVGLHVLDPETWKELGFKAKTEGQQFINRLRNKLGGDSAGWKMIDTPEFQQFMKTGPKTTQEVQDFVNKNGPKVEVRKFGQGSMTTPEQRRFAELNHYFDSLPASQRGVANHYLTHLDEESYNNLGRLNPEAQRFASEYNTLNKKELHKGVEESHWQSIAPKSEQDMPGYTEIAVVKPSRVQSATQEQGSRGQNLTRIPRQEADQFPSSHSFPPNTLGFVRGYMETTPQGKKIFHVIEVQSDWAQAVREEQKTGTRYGSHGNVPDPLLPHYERLALKAAIDHAREQGADAIAISDAETAMMTEGHDRAAIQPDTRGSESSELEIPQENGMRLHYDRTLPKIAEELTGEKGTKESFGEHRMSLGDLKDTGEERGLRKDLIFRNETGQPKTDITARVYPITKAAKDFSIIGKDKPRQVGNQGVSSESGMIDLSGARESLEKGIENLKEFFSDEGIRRKTMKMAGVSVPRTTAANEQVGNQLTMFAQAEGVAEAKARSMASEVLGSHWKDKDFDAKLGAVGVEDQLRTKKAQLLAAGKTAEAQSVNTVVGQPYSPIKSEAQYQQLKNAPEIKAALTRHIATVQGLAEQKQTALKGAIRSVGQDTGSFFNLIAKGVDSGEVRKARQGNTLATLKGGTRFGKEFKGTGTEYETSYRKMAERMVKGNWTEVEKQKLFDLVDSSGFGHLQKAGEDLPTFDKPMSPIPVQRRMAVIIKPGDKPIMKNQNETLWVPKASAEEFRQAFQTDSPLKEGLIKNISSVVTKVQTGLGADAAFHVGNMAAAVVTSPEKATAVKLMVQNLAKTFENNPEVQRKLAAMAEEAGIVREGETEVTAWKKLIPGKNMISWVDQAGRLTLDQLYKDAVKRGESPNNPVWRRAAVQGALGEYNKRLMPKVQQLMKESGLSPFLTAGKTFNRLSVRQLMMSPGRKSASLQGGAKMRLKQALYTTGLVVALPMIINNAMTGHPFPQGVEPGQFVVKKNEDGSYVVEDVAQLLMLRRGLRNTGIQAIAHGIEDKQSVGQIVKQGTKDVARGIIRPFAGPTVSAADTITGGGLLMDKPNEPISQRLKEAGKQANPTAEVVLNSDESKTSGEKFIGRFGRTIGLKVTQTAVSRINGLARDWKERNGVAMDNSPRGPYFDLTSALRKNDAQGARRALASVGLADKKDELIKQYYDKIATKPFTDSNEHEKAFVGELSEEDKKVYQSVKDSNAQVRERFYNIFMGRPAPRLPREGREERPARENKFLSR